MNLAILLSVGTYKDESHNLPACKNDHALMDAVLTHSGRFSEVLMLSTDTNSSHIKSELARFIKAHSGQPVDELFFYYTGHGDFYNDDFYFLLSDYDESKRQQTALSNAELDAMLRSLSPSLTVKVIDACHSGVPYVKNANHLKKAIQASKGRYEKCYFMFSSQKDEASYQDAHLSDFTESFARSLSEHSHNTIRYKDIADYISDEFENKGQQTPSFVLQADLTDVFCNISQEMREEISKKLTQCGGKRGATKQESVSTTTTTTTPPPPQVPTKTLRDLVIQDASRYCTEPEAMSGITAIKQQIEAHALCSELSGLYKLESVFRSDFSASPKIESVASWLQNNTNDYFVSVEYRSEEYEDTVEVPRTYRGLSGSQMAAMAAFRGDYETKIVRKIRKVPDGISLTVTPPFCAAEIKLIPQYANLPWLSENLVVVFSKSAVRLFYSTVQLKEKNWTERVLAEEVKWKTKEVGLKSSQEVEEVVESMIRDIESVATKILHDKFRITDGSALRSAGQNQN
jgi:hypothetical protein